jgi:hypothetical protein
MPPSHAQATHGCGGDRSAPTTVSTPALASPSAPLIRALSHRGSAARAGSIIAMVTDVPSAENADQTLPASQLPRVRSNLYGPITVMPNIVGCPGSVMRARTAD